MTAEATPPLTPDFSAPPELFAPPASAEPPVSTAPVNPYTRTAHSSPLLAGLIALIVLAGIGIGFAAGHISRTASQAQRVSRTYTQPSFPNFTSPTLPNTQPGFAAPASPVQPSAAESALLTRLAPSLVLISTTSSYDGSQGAATGMVISSSGLVLTNNHVVAGATSVSAQLASGGPTYSATVLGYSISSDVALIQLVGAPSLTPVRFASSLPVVGQSVTALGNAGGTGFLTPAAGIITSLSRHVSVSGPVGTENLKGLYTSSAAVVPGDSGGPLLNAHGRVVAMDTAAQVSSGFSSTAPRSFAIPASTALALVAQIRSRSASPDVHVGPTAFLGVSVATPSAVSFYENDQPLASNGVTIMAVLPGTPAASSSLVAGDVITLLDGSKITTPTALTALVSAHAPGSSVTVGFTTPSSHHGTISITLSAGPAQ